MLLFTMFDFQHFQLNTKGCEKVSIEFVNHTVHSDSAFT